MERDKITDSYRKQVDDLLDNQSGSNPFNTLDNEETNEIWERISADMDIGEIWLHISSDLDKIMPPDPGSGIFIKTVAAVLVILIGLIPGKKALLDPVISHPEIFIETEKSERPPDLIFRETQKNSNITEQVKEVSPPGSASGANYEKNEDGNNILPPEKTETKPSPDVPIPLYNALISEIKTVPGVIKSDPLVFQDKISVEKSIMPPVVLPVKQESTKMIAGSDSDILKVNTNHSDPLFSLPSPVRGRFSLGLITSFKNTWLLNQETFDGLRSESLNTTEIVFFPDVGLSLDYSLNKKWSLQTEGFFYSNTGQEYFDYIYGHYSKKTITLRYSTVVLSVKYKLSHKGDNKHPFSINFLAGTYVSVLHSADQEINAYLENIKSQYEKFDLGVRLGSEFELHLSDNLSLAPGLMLSYGIPNIYKGDGNIPGYLRNTRNGSAGFNLTFYYYFR